MSDQNESIPFADFQAWIAAHTEEIQRLRARITDLEAQIDALRNPPYRIDIEAPEGGFSDCGYQYTIYPQRAAIKVDDGFETELAAREAAQRFIASLTAPKE